MPVSKKRKKDGKPVQRSATADPKPEGSEHPEEHHLHPQQKGGKPRNPFVTKMPQVHGSQRGR